MSIIYLPFGSSQQPYYQFALANGEDLLAAQHPLDWLAPEEIAQAPKGVRRTPWLGSRTLLSILLHHPPTLPKMAITQNGKPSFIDPNLPRFNISHSQDYVALLLAASGQVGCDIEVIRPIQHAPGLIKHCFNRQEQHWLSTQPPSNQRQAFWRLWTLKEAIIKFEGATVFDLPQISLPIASLQQPSFAFDHYFLWQQRWHTLHIALCGSMPFAPHSALRQTTIKTPITAA